MRQIFIYYIDILKDYNFSSLLDFRQTKTEQLVDKILAQDQDPKTEFKKPNPLFHKTVTKFEYMCYDFMRLMTKDIYHTDDGNVEYPYFVKLQSL